METKRCPRCGEEIPVGMQFCLHCMERTEGVLEIKQKHAISKKWLLLVILLLCVTAVIIGSIAVIVSGRNHDALAEQSASSTTEEPIRTDTPMLTTSTDITVSVTDLTSSASGSSDTQITPNNVNENPATDAQNPEQPIQSDIPKQPHSDDVPATTPLQSDTPSQSSKTTTQTNTSTTTSMTTTSTTAAQTAPFEEWFRGQMSRWGGSKIYKDSLSFSGDSCTFEVQIVSARIPAALTVSPDRSTYTLILHTAYTNLTMPAQISDIIKELNFLVMDDNISGVDVQTVDNAARNPGTEYTADENGKHWVIRTDNIGSEQPLTVSCSMTG